MRLALGILLGFWLGLLAAAIMFVRTDRILETGTFYKLRVCVMERDRLNSEKQRLVEDVEAYVRAIQQVSTSR